MSIQVYSDGNLIPVKSFVFKGGEVQVKAELENSNLESLHIYAFLQSSNDVMELLLITDALRQQTIGKNVEFILEMPYVPYARQDRVMNPGEALSIKVFCNLINSQNYDRVIIHDPHSDVTPALLTNVEVINQADIVSMAIPFNFKPRTSSYEKDYEEDRAAFVARTVLVSPDAGANKKIFKVAQECGIEHVVRADKVRDTKTNEILETVVYSDHVGDKDFLIVDDIADGGRTFIELAKVLRPLTNGKIILFVTHGIFSYGLDVFKGVIDEVYCSHSFGKYPEGTELLHPNNI